jgi:hypothetical protein
MAYGTSDTHKQLKNDMPKSLVGLYASINQCLLDTFTALIQLGLTKSDSLYAGELTFVDTS